MKINRKQWAAWTLPSKSSYVGMWLGLGGLLLALAGIALAVYIYQEAKLHRADFAATKLSPTSIDLLTVLEPDSDLMFSKTGGLADCIGQLSYDQLIKMDIVDIIPNQVSSFDFPVVTLKLTDFGADVRRYALKTRGDAATILPCLVFAPQALSPRCETAPASD